MGSGAPHKCGWCGSKDKSEYILDIKILPPDSIKKIQSFYRGYLLRKSLDTFYQKQRTRATSKNFKEIGLSFNTEKYDTNPRIIQLTSLLPKFSLDEKEIYLINTSNLETVGLLYPDNSIYKGTINDKYQKEGFGKLFYPDGSIYEGFFKGNKNNGRGRLLNIEGFIYEGEFMNCLAHGYGKLIGLNGSSYKGNWENDKKNGFGDESYADGSHYYGDFINNTKNGKGAYYFADGNYYEGNLENNYMTGEGIKKWKDGRIFVGRWKNNKMNGYGIFHWPDNKKYYGNYSKNIKCGFGTFYWADGKIYEGLWKDGKQNGYGYIHFNEERTYGEWLEGKLVHSMTNEDDLDFITNFLNKEKETGEYIEFTKNIEEYEKRLQSLKK